MMPSASVAIAATVASLAKAAATWAGKRAMPKPITPVTAKASPPPVQAMRRASAQSPAPTARPTSAVSAEPMPKASGIIRNSMRAEMP